MFFLKEIFRKALFYIYQSKAKKYLSKYLYLAKNSKFNCIKNVACMFIDFKKNILDYFKFKINDEVIKNLGIYIRDSNSENLLINSSDFLAKTKIEIITYPKISIITPNFNQGKFLEVCIQSVLSQNYPNFEYIIIDGGSTDSSKEIIEKYKKNLHFWVSEKDNGQADAINKGLKYATGEIFNWLNSDDRLMPNALFRCAETYQENPSAVGWVGACSRMDTRGDIIEIIFPNGLDRENIGQNWNGKQFYQPSCFLSTAKVKEIGGLTPNLYIALDLDLWIRILEKGSFVAGKGIWSEAISHEDAKTQKFIEKMYQETIELQRKYGFFEGAENREKCLKCINGHRLYTISENLKERLNKVNNLIRTNDSFSYNKRTNICFIGNFDSKHDIDAVVYFINEIFPVILKRNWIEFHVIGNNANKYKRLFRLHNVKFFGKVKNIKEVLSKYKIFVSPMTREGGMKGKIGIAAAAGLPIVTTSIGADGFPIRDGEECFIADSPIEFAEKCNQLLNDQIAWHNFSIKSRLMIAENSNPYKDAGN